MKTQPLNIQTIWKQVQSTWKKLVVKLPTPPEHEPETHTSQPEFHHDAVVDTSQIWSLSFIFWFAGVVVVYV